ncbi:MAG: hypothetical protein HY274_02975 [Gammaproteobacteria bacterium]|nr:hypothetical protein [Gammaproteobacteria bacterium]
MDDKKPLSTKSSTAPLHPVKAVVVGEVVRSAAPIGSAKAQISHKQMTEMIQSLGTILSQPEVLQGVSYLSKKIVTALAPLAPAFKALGSMAVLIGETVSKLPEKFQTTLVALANRGWFLDPEIAWHILVQAASAIDEGTLDEADAMMVAHFENRLADIESKLSAALPHRASKFKSAFAAHRRGEYDLSILAFMAQADGICAELRGGHFFLKDRTTGKSLAAPPDSVYEGEPLARIARLALSDDLPIRERLSKRAKSGSTALNRHAVMHGESLDYDNKDNSLRALSLLNYVALGLDESEGSPLKRAGATTLGSLVNIAGKSDTAQ